MNKKLNVYEVTVGNIGTVYSGKSKQEAKADYREYKSQSIGGHGRAAYEEVVLWKNGEPLYEHLDALNNICKRCHLAEFATKNCPDCKAVREVHQMEMKRDYRKSQLDNVKHSPFFPKVKFAQAGETKWLDITHEEFEAIKDIMLGKVKTTSKPRNGDMFLRKDGMTWKVLEARSVTSYCENIRTGKQAFISNQDIS